MDRENNINIRATRDFIAAIKIKYSITLFIAQYDNQPNSKLNCIQETLCG
jgi:hypothetical protein